MFVCMFVCKYVRIYVSMNEYMYVCMCVCMYMYVCMYVCTCMYLWMYVYIHVCMCVCLLVSSFKLHSVRSSHLAAARHSWNKFNFLFVWWSLRPSIKRKEKQLGNGKRTQKEMWNENWNWTVSNFVTWLQICKRPTLTIMNLWGLYVWWIAPTSVSVLLYTEDELFLAVSTLIHNSNSDLGSGER